VELKTDPAAYTPTLTDTAMYTQNICAHSHTHTHTHTQRGLKRMPDSVPQYGV